MKDVRLKPSDVSREGLVVTVKIVNGCGTHETGWDSIAEAEKVVGILAEHFRTHRSCSKASTVNKLLKRFFPEGT